MKPRPLGTTGLLLPPIALGTVKLGRVAALKYAHAPTALPTDEQTLVLLRAALALGVTLIDTAPAYGLAERRLGELLPAVAPSDRWTICTKVGERFDPATGTSSYDFSPRAIADSVARSIDLLRRPKLDIVLLHFASAVDDAAVLRAGHAAAALLDLKARGVISAVGASTASPDAALLALGLHPAQPAAAPSLDCVMVTLNALDRTAIPLIAQAAAAGRGVLVKKPLASGHADPAASLALVLGTPGVTSVVVGTTSTAHLTQAVEAAR